MKQDQPKAYTWVFTDGTKIILRTDENEITAAELEYLQRLDQRDANDRRRYRRHNVGLESTSVYSEKSYLWMDTHGTALQQKGSQECWCTGSIRAH